MGGGLGATSLGCKQMNKIKFIIVCLFFIIPQFSFAQIINLDHNEFYIGLTPGFGYKELGDSRFGFKFGGTMYYHMGNSFFNLSYNRYFGLDLKFGDNNKPDNSKFEKIDFTFGHSIQLHKTHPLLKHICFFFDSGISFSNIEYYKNDSAHFNNSITNLQSFGIPLGLGLTNDWNGLLYTGFEYKFNIIQNSKPFNEFSAFLVFNIF
ncbi:MAG: hypothetical protein WAU11_03435 [Ignavibacteriaceae bacterium]